MSGKSKQAKLREFSEKEREKIKTRDKGRCIFCEMRYHMEKADWFGTHIFSIMHYIPRSKNGLGIEQNGAVGCQYHHDMMDNGYYGRRGEMLSLFKDYLKIHYPDWNEEELVYNKWKN